MPHLKVNTSLRVMRLPSEFRVNCISTIRETLDCLVHIINLLHVLLDPLQVNAVRSSITERHIVWVELKHWEILSSIFIEEIVITNINFSS